MKATTTRTTRRHRLLLSLLALLLAIPLLLSVSQAPASAVTKPTGVSLTGKYTAARLSWTAVSGATAYEVQYSKSSTFSSPTSVTTTTNYAYANRLSTGSTYYFRVRVKTPALSSWTNASSSFHPYYPSKYPGTENAVQKAINLAADNVSGSTIDLTWATASGQYECFRIAVSPTPSGGQPEVVCNPNYVIKGLSRSTTYAIKIYTVLAAGDGWPDIDLSGASSTLNVTTSDYELAAPYDLTISNQKSASVTVGWTAPDRMKSTYVYKVQVAMNTAMTSSMIWWPTTTPTNSITLTGLKSNTAYFVRVVVVDANGTQRSDKSSYILAKTLIPAGTITGKITGPPAADVVAVAYDTASGELADQVDVASDGSYKLSVRPGTYRVRATYIGNANYYSSWVSSTVNPAVVSSQADILTVKLETNTAAAATVLGSGAKVTGTAVDQISGAVVAPVEVSLLSGLTGSHEVIARTMTNSGTFIFNGVPDGGYRIRIEYNSGDGYQRKTVSVTVAAKGNVTIPNAEMERKNFAATHGVSVGGTKRVGYTVRASYTAWVAQSSPVVTRPLMTYQWRRSGVNISGATGSSYKLTSADRGKYISVVITGRKTGYNTASRTASSVKIY